jgi:ribosomal protein S18 acetylase RimI-like enzyme
MTHLAEGYTIRTMSAEEFGPFWKLHADTIFNQRQPILNRQEIYSEEEKKKVEELRAELKSFTLRLGVFHGEEFVGWSLGNQEDAETYYMRNSAILPTHRRKGLYTALLKTKIAMLTEKGFQRIYSRHNSTNNAVIIPKLKSGFVISALEVSDVFGTLVHLSYFTNPERRKIMDFRSGESLPDPIVLRALGMEKKR